VKGHPPKTICSKPRKNSFNLQKKTKILQLISLSKKQKKKREEKVSKFNLQIKGKVLQV
jgi:hypothetical protein